MAEGAPLPLEDLIELGLVSILQLRTAHSPPSFPKASMNFQLYFL